MVGHSTEICITADAIISRNLAPWLGWLAIDVFEDDGALWLSFKPAPAELILLLDG